MSRDAKYPPGSGFGEGCGYCGSLTHRMVQGGGPGPLCVTMAGGLKPNHTLDAEPEVREHPAPVPGGADLTVRVVLRVRPGKAFVYVPAPRHRDVMLAALVDSLQQMVNRNPEGWEANVEDVAWSATDMMLVRLDPDGQG